MRTLLFVATLATAIAAPSAFAQATGFTSRIDANTFIVGHPASPSWKTVHSHGEHPAVIIAARARAQAPDSNAFLVQPPASVRWTAQPLPVVLARVPG